MNRAAALPSRVLPAKLVQDVGGPWGRFLQRYGGRPLLCVRLPETGSELESALDAAVSNTPQARRAAMAFRTLDICQSSTEPAPSMSRFGVNALRRRLTGGRHFVLQLVKRTESSGVMNEWISVGRAPNTDVVLRDPSVSKFHARFRVDQDGRIWLADAGSTNGTYLAGAKLPTKDVHEVSDGDLVVFGKVPVFICRADGIWKAFHDLDTHHH